MMRNPSFGPPGFVPTVISRTALGVAVAQIRALGIRAFASTLVATFVVLVVTGCGDSGEPQPVTRESTPVPTEAIETVAVVVTRSALSETALAGQELFNANCALCHGANAGGTEQGPTLIDRIYHPGHHSDFSFRRAVAQGVPQHHWTFGAMPPVATVSADAVEQIICYIRELQREAGIFDGDSFATVC